MKIQQETYKITHNIKKRQTNTSIPQQIKFTEKLDEDDGAKVFLLCVFVEKQLKYFLKSSLDSIVIMLIE